MNELMKLVRGGRSLSRQTQDGVAAMRERLGIKPSAKSISCIALVFDATGSMQDVWQNAKKKHG